MTTLITKLVFVPIKLNYFVYSQHTITFRIKKNLEKLFSTDTSVPSSSHILTIKIFFVEKNMLRNLLMKQPVMKNSEVTLLVSSE